MQRTGSKYEQKYNGNEHNQGNHDSLTLISDELSCGLKNRNGNSDFPDGADNHQEGDGGNPPADIGQGIQQISVVQGIQSRNVNIALSCFETDDSEEYQHCEVQDDDADD